MGLNGPDNRRTQRLLGSHSDPNFKKASGFWKNNATGIQRHFEAADGQIFLPNIPASSDQILGKFAKIRSTSVER